MPSLPSSLATISRGLRQILSSFCGPFIVIPCGFRQGLVLLTLSGFAHAAATHVTVGSRQLLVDGSAFTMKGVSYSPTPVGSTVGNPDSTCTGPYQWWTDRMTYRVDFPLIKAMGANSIRTYDLMNSTATSTDVLQALDEARAQGLYVMMGYFIESSEDFSDPAVRARLSTQALAAVAVYKDHPAVLMWIIGNEQNLTNGQNAAWYPFLNTLAGDIKALDPHHPVTTVEGEILGTGPFFNIGNAGRSADDASMTNLDLWGVIAYRGPSFGTLFSSLAANTSKPLFVGEFGKDAYKDSLGSEDQDLQATHLVSQWGEIASHLSANAPTQAFVGGTLFEWSDEWWKDSGASCSIHNTRVVFTRPADTADPNYNEEWFGLVSVAPINAITNPSGTQRNLRTGYLRMQSLWNPSAPASNSAGVFEGTVRNYPNPFRVGSEPTTFVASMAVFGTLKVSIYDASGRKVITLPESTAVGPGRLEVQWNGRNDNGAYVSSGLYHVKIEGQGSGREEKQMRRVVAVK